VVRFAWFAMGLGWVVMWGGWSAAPLGWLVMRSRWWPLTPLAGLAMWLA